MDFYGEILDRISKDSFNSTPAGVFSTNPQKYAQLGGGLSLGRDLGKNGVSEITGGAGKDSGQGQFQLGGSNAAARNADLQAGYDVGRQMFYDDPDMQILRQKREDLSKGYSGQELGALKGQAESEMQGQRQNIQRNLAGKAARAGIGGARSAAMSAASDEGLNKNRAELERKMSLDNANMVRSGTKDLQDYIMSQKYGQLGTGLGYAQLGVTDRSADSQAQAAASAARGRDKGPIGGLISDVLSIF